MIERKPVVANMARRSKQALALLRAQGRSNHEEQDWPHAPAESEALVGSVPPPMPPTQKKKNKANSEGPRT